MKIADFGVSKRTKGTKLHTQLGSHGYIAPELLGLLPRKYTRDCYSKAVDMWALGCLVHELLTGQLPFREIEYEPDDTSEYEPEVTTEYDRGSDMFMEPRTDFCDGETELPTNLLTQFRVSDLAIEFLKLILVANPESRQAAKDALGSAWLACEVQPGINISGEVLITNTSQQTSEATTSQGDPVINNSQQEELSVDPPKGEMTLAPKSAAEK